MNRDVATASLIEVGLTKPEATCRVPLWTIPSERSGTLSF